jgi:hypothetical protein
MDERWGRLLLTELLYKLREAADTPPVDDRQEYEGNKTAFIKAQKKRNSAGKIHLPTKSAAGGFIKDGAKWIGDLIGGMALIGADGRAVASAEERLFLEKSARVEQTLQKNEKHLELLLPDPASSDDRRWPGPITYRSALNHFVAICIRVHSIAPEVLFEEVIFNVAKRVLVPGLAHNMKFFARENPNVYRLFVHNDEICYRLGLKWVDSEEQNKTVPASERHVFRKWVRLFNVMVEAAAFISPERRGEMFVSFQNLLKDHEAEPRSSQLWKELSILASGDMAVDEILVSCVLGDVGVDAKDLTSSPLVNCARARFGLLRYAYSMQREMEAFRERFSYGQTEVEGILRRISIAPSEKQLDDDLSNEAFGWAYIFSRHLLLGRQRKDDDKESLDNRRLASSLLCGLLEAIVGRKSAGDAEERMLALRYLLGYLTNPRFIKSPEYMRKNKGDSDYNSGYIEDFIKMAEREEPGRLPRSIVNLARARVALHHAISRGDDLDACSRGLQAALDHYTKILDDMASPMDAGVMDGEVIAWALPEIHFAIGKLSASCPGDEPHWEAVQKALIILGEVQYGVYYNPSEESQRIERGIQHAVGKS